MEWVTERSVVVRVHGLECKWNMNESVCENE